MSAAVRLDDASPAVRPALVGAEITNAEVTHVVTTRRAVKQLRVAGPMEILAVDDDHADFHHLARYRR